MRNVNQFSAVSVFLIMLFILSNCAGTTLTSKMNTSRKSSLDDKKPLEITKPKSMKPLDVPLINQMDSPQLYNGCEVSSLAMMLTYHGYETTKNELAKKISHVPLTYENGLKGNPNKGFVGDMEDGPGLTVYHDPIHNLAKQYAGNKVIDITGESMETLYHYLSKGLPVWVITTVTYAPVNDFETWNTPSGKIDVTFSVHSVVVTGFDEKHIYINNPYGQKNQQVDKKSFVAAWKQMGSQAVVITE